MIDKRQADPESREQRGLKATAALPAGGAGTTRRDEYQQSGLGRAGLGRTTSTAAGRTGIRARGSAGQGRAWQGRA